MSCLWNVLPLKFSAYEMSSAMKWLPLKCPAYEISCLWNVLLRYVLLRNVFLWTVTTPFPLEFSPHFPWSPLYVRHWKVNLLFCVFKIISDHISILFIFTYSPRNLTRWAQICRNKGRLNLPLFSPWTLTKLDSILSSASTNKKKPQIHNGGYKQ